MIISVTDWVLSVRRTLRPGEVARVDKDCVLDMVPHYWREEAPTIPEWFERSCGGLGLHCVYDLIRDDFTVSLQ